MSAIRQDLGGFLIRGDEGDGHRVVKDLPGGGLIHFPVDYGDEGQAIGGFGGVGGFSGVVVRVYGVVSVGVVSEQVLDAHIHVVEWERAFVSVKDASVADDAAEDERASEGEAVASTLLVGRAPPLLEGLDDETICHAGEVVLARLERVGVIKKEKEKEKKKKKRIKRTVWKQDQLLGAYQAELGIERLGADRLLVSDGLQVADARTTRPVSPFWYQSVNAGCLGNCLYVRDPQTKLFLFLSSITRHFIDIFKFIKLIP